MIFFIFGGGWGGGNFCCKIEPQLAILNMINVDQNDIRIQKRNENIILSINLVVLRRKYDCNDRRDSN